MKIFLCHASQDKQVTRDLCERLVGDGHDVWFDERNLLPGQDWAVEIQRAVKDSDVVLVLISKNSISKVGFVQRELRLALDAADERPEGMVFIIPVRIDDAPIPDRLSRWQWLDVRNSGWYDRLAVSLGSVASGPGGSGRHVSLRAVDASPVVVDLLGLDHVPARLAAGQSIRLDYRLRLWSDQMLPVVLGASLVGVHGDEYYDVTRDREVSLSPEIAVYRRHLLVPLSTPVGTYRLLGAVWFPKVGGRRLATLDCGFTVEIY